MSIKVSYTDRIQKFAQRNIEKRCGIKHRKFAFKEIKKGYRNKHKKIPLIVNKLYCSPTIITVLLFFLSIRIYVLFTYGIYKLALGKKWETKQKHTLKISSDCKPNVLVTCENHLDTVFQYKHPRIIYLWNIEISTRKTQGNHAETNIKILCLLLK